MKYRVESAKAFTREDAMATPKPPFGQFTILRARRELEMDVDLSHNDVVQNIDRDSPDQITIYGTEADGTLYYIVLSQQLIDRIKEI